MKTMQIESWTKLPVNNSVSGHCRILQNQHKAHLNFNMILLQLSVAVFFTTVRI